MASPIIGKNIAHNSFADPFDAGSYVMKYITCTPAGKDMRQNPETAELEGVDRDEFSFVIEQGPPQRNGNAVAGRTFKVSIFRPKGEDSEADRRSSDKYAVLAKGMKADIKENVDGQGNDSLDFTVCEGKTYNVVLTCYTSKKNGNTYNDVKSIKAQEVVY